MNNLSDMSRKELEAVIEGLERERFFTFMKGHTVSEKFIDTATAVRKSRKVNHSLIDKRNELEKELFMLNDKTRLLDMDIAKHRKELSTRRLI